MPSYNDISRSREAPESRKKIDPVASGNVSDKKAANFIVEIFQPIIFKAVSDMLTTAMDTIKDLVIGAADMRMYGEYKHKLSRSGYTNYSGISKLSRGYSGSLLNVYEDFDLSGRRSYKAGYEVKAVEFDTYGDAELVLDAVRELIDMYGDACVGDYYALCKVSSSHTDFNYGWKNLDRAEVRRYQGKYIITLPRPIPLD